MSPEELEAIRERVGAANLDGSWDEPAERDRYALLREVDRLQAQINSAQGHARYRRLATQTSAQIAADADRRLEDALDGAT